MSTLPNLSTWHLVPIGAIIPKGTPYAYAYENSVNVRFNGPPEDFTVRDNSYYTHYTEHPILPPLPTEEEATILVSRDSCSPHILLTRKADDWVDHYGVRWYVEQITSWCPVTVGEAVVIRERQRP